MRYLEEPFIIGALRRGRSVEQFLGPIAVPQRPGVRYVEVRPAGQLFEVYVHAVQDVGHEGFLDLMMFPPFDQNAEEEEFGQFLGATEDPHGALHLARKLGMVKMGRVALDGAELGRGWRSFGGGSICWLSWWPSGEGGGRGCGSHGWPSKECTRPCAAGSAGRG
ncbi:hypothetical protein AB0M29_19125 [Streptomyces sp. NPDC051976]|uniref:hypothetical protein n=1 Tax=Streptomyces sp. NPDC051976 TaxID=3154947 RepID=UPI0034143E08